MKKNKPYGAAAALLAGALLGGLMTAPGAHAVDFRVRVRSPSSKVIS